MMEASSYDIQLSTVPHPPQASLVLLASVIEHSCIPNMSERGMADAIFLLAIFT